MDLLKLRYFYTVAEFEHVTKAAEKLHIAQPAITKTIKLLESELGVPLFIRVGRNVKLTEYGELLKRKLDGVFNIVDSIPDEIERMKKNNSFTVKLNVLAASIAVMEAVVKYKNKNPEVIFNLIQNVEKSDCDISVTTDYGGEILSRSKERKIIKERNYLAVPKNSKFATQNSVSLSSLADENFINIAGSRAFRTICDKFCERAGFKPKIGFESDSPIAVKNIIGADAGVGFWPEYSWGKINSHDVALVPIKEENCYRNIIIDLHDTPTRSKYAQDFYEYLYSSLIKKQK